MARKPLIETADFPYHVTNRSNNKDCFYLDLDSLWEICVEVLSQMFDQYDVRIHVFILMTNHYHLIVSTPKSNISDAILYFQREIARKANKKTGRINHFFGGRYKWCVIHSEQYYWNALKYVFRNPVAANICQKVEQYKYSSLNYSPKKFRWEVVDFFFDQTKKVNLDLNWLNNQFTIEQGTAIAKALRRREFKLPVDKSGKLLVLDTMQRKKGLGT